MKTLACVLSILPITAFADFGLPTQPYVYVEGTAEIQKTADIVTLRFDLTARAPDQPKANELVQAKANRIFAMIKERKIADNDVIAEDLQSQPEFEQEENYSHGRGKLIGYKVTRPFQIKVRDLATFPKLADDFVGIEGVEFSGIEGGLAKEKELEPEVWQKALANAREQAEKTLKPLNMKIDSVFAVSPVSFPEIVTRIFTEGDGVVMGVRSAKLPAASGQPIPEYHVAPITVRQNVHVIYLISPTK